jgi:hypothetical protein
MNVAHVVPALFGPGGVVAAPNAAPSSRPPHGGRSAHQTGDVRRPGPRDRDRRAPGARAGAAVAGSRPACEPVSPRHLPGDRRCGHRALPPAARPHRERRRAVVPAQRPARVRHRAGRRRLGRVRVRVNRPLVPRASPPQRVQPSHLRARGPALGARDFRRRRHRAVLPRPASPGAARRSSWGGCSPQRIDDLIAALPCQMPLRLVGPPNGAGTSRPSEPRRPAGRSPSVTTR